MKQTRLSIAQFLLALGALAAASAISGPARAGETAVDPALQNIIAGDHRKAAYSARDIYRHPAETLTFFGLKPDMTVVEIWPGGGWYMDIIAPYVKDKGKYYAAGRNRESTDKRVQREVQVLDDRVKQRPDLFGSVIVTELSRQKGDIAPPGSADMVLTFRNIHNWMKFGFERQIFDAMFKALKPGGILGIVEHRADPAEFPDPQALSGYVHEEQVQQMAKATGFEFVAASEINANSKDTRKHPKGVWTLPPGLRLKDQDRAKYLAIGESDRITVMFRKPVK